MALCVSNPAVLLPLSAPSAASAAPLRDWAGLPDIDEPDVRGQILQTGPVVPGPIGDGDTLQLSVLPGRLRHPLPHLLADRAFQTGLARFRKPGKSTLCQHRPMAALLGHNAAGGLTPAMFIILSIRSSAGIRSRVPSRAGRLAMNAATRPAAAPAERSPCRTGSSPDPTRPPPGDDFSHQSATGPHDHRAPQRPDPTARGPNPRPKQAGQILFEPRIRQLRRRGLQGVRIGLGHRDVRVSIGHPRVPSQRSPSWRECRLGTLTSSRQTHPTTSPRSGQIPGFFQKIRQTTQTHTIRIQKTTHFQQVENSQVRQTRTTPTCSRHMRRGLLMGWQRFAVIRDLRLASDHHVRHGVSIHCPGRDVCRSGGCVR